MDEMGSKYGKTNGQGQGPNMAKQMVRDSGNIFDLTYLQQIGTWSMSDTMLVGQESRP